MDIITRKDKYYSAIANGTADVPKPITRQEQYLYAMATKSGVVPDPITPNDPYLYAICKGTKDIPAPLTRVQKYLYAIATGDDKYGIPAPVTHEEYWLAKILGVDVGGGTQPPQDDTPPEWAAVFKAIDDGTYKEKYSIGDTVPLDLGEEGVVDMQIVAFDADELADGSGYAPITWISKQTILSDHRMNPQRSGNSGNYKEGTGAIGGWEKTEMRIWLSESVFPLIPNKVRHAIRGVIKYSDIYIPTGQSMKDVIGEDYIWLPSGREVGLSGYEYYGPAYKTVFIDQSARVKNKVGSELPTNWWTRSASDINGFVLINNSGKGAGTTSIFAYGIPLCFCT